MWDLGAMFLTMSLAFSQASPAMYMSSPYLTISILMNSSPAWEGGRGGHVSQPAHPH